LLVGAAFLARARYRSHGMPLAPAPVVPGGRTMKRTVVPALFGLLLFSFGNVEAQTSFDELPRRVKPGQKVYVTDPLARETEGTLVRLSTTSLTLLVRGAEREFPRAEVESVSRRGDSVRNGMIIGMLVAGGLGLASVLTDDCSADFAAATCAGVVGLNAAMGAGVGALIDYGVKGKTLVYRSKRAAVSAAPLFLRTGAAVQLALRF
jgi:hypothetical protein